MIRKIHAFLFGAILLALAGVLLVPAAHAQTAQETLLYTFCSQGGSSCTDGQEVDAGLVEGTDGNFYGTTYAGGPYGNTGFGYGTVFMVTPSGAMTTLHDFCSQGGIDCPDGETVAAGLTLASTGEFYGATQKGGVDDGGTIYKITSQGTLTTLYIFCAETNCADGNSPHAAPIQGKDGNFYGTTAQGGANNYGEVYRMSATGALTVLYSFCGVAGCADGAYPFAGLVQAGDGNFYGTTVNGGAYNSGSIFRITAQRTLTTLYSFCRQQSNTCADGENPLTALTVGTDGNLYGTTENGGANSAGTAFKISTAGALTTLHAFCSQGGSCADGQNPSALMQASDGNFYGTTEWGGSTGGGTLFRMTPAGALTTLYTFCTESECFDGDNPLAGVIQGTDGNFYGTTTGCGETPSGGTGRGTVFKFSGPAKSGSTTGLTATPTAASVGQSLTFTATVAGGAATPGGSVTFFMGGQTLGAVALNASGVAMLTQTSNSFAVGTYPVVAAYAGNAGYSASTSSTVNVVLSKAVTATTLATSASKVAPPGKVTLTATVKRSAAGSAGTPAGSVTFYFQTLALGSATLNAAGVATITASSKGVPAGKYGITAHYIGDSADANSASTVISVTVE